MATMLRFEVDVELSGDVDLDDVWTVVSSFVRERLDGTVRSIAVGTVEIRRAAA